MYLPNVLLYHKKIGSATYDVIDIAAKVLYRDNNIIISENTVYDKPHILLGVGDGFINYGFIAFKELELEEKQGSVGLILDINDVEVTPSRESVIWSPLTRKAVMKSYEKVVETATKMINDTLNQEVNFFAWVVKASQIKASINSSTNTATQTQAFQKLASILDPSAIQNITYYGHGNTIKYDEKLEELLSKKVLVRSFNYLSYSRKVERVKIKTAMSLSAYSQFYITKGTSDKYRDRYISEELAKGAFVVVKLLEDYENSSLAKLVEMDSSLLDYDAVTVPEDTLDRYILEEENDGEITDDEGTTIKYDSNRLARLRKKEQKVLYHSAYQASPFSYSSYEVKIIDIDTSFANQNVVYGTFSDRELLNNTFRTMPFYLLSFSISGYSTAAYRFTEELQDEFLEYYDLRPHTLTLISADVQKHFITKPNFTHISKFIVESYKDGKIIFNKALRVAFTYNIIRKMLREQLGYSVSIAYDDDSKFFFGDNAASIVLASDASSKCASSTIDDFYYTCINYELNKRNGLDDIILKQNLQRIDELLPDQLCEFIDDIDDVSILDHELLDEVQKIIDFYSKFSHIYEGLSSHRAGEALKQLKDFIEKYETPPTISRKF